MCGGRFSIARRSGCNVSPVRTAVRISGIISPRSPASARISPNGASRFFWMSLPRALSGETYSTSVRSVRSPASALRTSRSIQARNAASVLPDPVGAEINVVRPARMCGQPCSCGSVGVPKREINHSATRGCAQDRDSGRDCIRVFYNFRQTFAKSACPLRTRRITTKLPGIQLAFEVYLLERIGWEIFVAAFAATFRGVLLLGLLFWFETGGRERANDADAGILPSCSDNARSCLRISPFCDLSAFL